MVCRTELVVGDETHRHRQAGLVVLGERRRVFRCTACGQHVADVRLVDHVRAPCVVPLRQPDVHVGAEGFGDLLSEERAKRAAGDALDQFAEDEAEADHVVALCGPRRPPRFGRGQFGTDAIPVEHVRRLHPPLRADDARTVRHHHRDGDRFLARLGELRPVGGDRLVQVELATIGQQMHARARQPLGPGEHTRQSVLLPRSLTVSVVPAAPQVDHEFAVDPSRHRGTDVAALGEVALELLPHGVERGCAVAADRNLGGSQLDSDEPFTRHTTPFHRSIGLKVVPRTNRFVDGIRS